MINLREIFSQDEFLEIQNNAKTECNDRIKKKNERENEVQQIKGTIHAILDLVNSFKWHGEAINHIDFIKQGEKIEVCVYVFRVNTNEQYISSIGVNTLSSFVLKAEEKVNELHWSASGWDEVHNIIKKFDGWYSRIEFITGRSSIVTGFKD